VIPALEHLLDELSRRLAIIRKKVQKPFSAAAPFGHRCWPLRIGETIPTIVPQRPITDAPKPAPNRNGNADVIDCRANEPTMSGVFKDG